MPRHDIRGRIACLDIKRHQTGSEWFQVSRYPAGSRTARCECHFDDVGLVREGTLTLGADWRPIDAHLRLNHQGRALGAGWLRFGADEVTDIEGRPQRHRRAHGGPVPAFGAQPILNDGFWTARFDLARPDAVQRLADSITCSKEMIGNARIAIETFDLDVSYLA